MSEAWPSPLRIIIIASSEKCGLRRRRRDHDHASHHHHCLSSLSLIPSSYCDVTRPHTCTCMYPFGARFVATRAIKSCDFCSACFFSPLSLHGIVQYAAVICTELENNSESGFIRFLQETHPFGKNIFIVSVSVRSEPYNNPYFGCWLCHPCPPQNLTRN